jgi:hypothetical protein
VFTCLASRTRGGSGSAAAGDRAAISSVTTMPSTASGIPMICPTLAAPANCPEPLFKAV